MTFMKYLLMLFLMFGYSTTMLADDAEECVDDLTTEENECEDDEADLLLSDSGDGFLGGDMSAYLVWGVGIALLNSDFGSDSGTATTN
jgi:hypothetical protein